MWVDSRPRGLLRDSPFKSVELKARMRTLRTTAEGGNRSFTRFAYLAEMTFQQTRLPLVLSACFLGLLAAPFAFCTYMAAVEHRLGVAILLLAMSGLLSILFLGAVFRAWHPTQLDVDDRGVTRRRWGRSEAWSWDQVSRFSFVDFRGATSIRFDAQEPEGLRKIALPSNWPGGATLMIARLNAARAQYSDSSWCGQPWQEAAPPKERQVLQFLIGAAAALLVVLVFGAAGFAHLKH